MMHGHHSIAATGLEHPSALCDTWLICMQTRIDLYADFGMFVASRAGIVVDRPHLGFDPRPTESSLSTLFLYSRTHVRAGGGRTMRSEWLLVENGTVIDATGSAAQVGASVLVQDNRIVAVGDELDLQVPRGAALTRRGRRLCRG
jgi:hypothetical protein